MNLKHYSYILHQTKGMLFWCTCAQTHTQTYTHTHTHTYRHTHTLKHTHTNTHTQTHTHTCMQARTNGYVITFEPFDWFSNFKKVNCSKFCQEFNFNLNFGPPHFIQEIPIPAYLYEKMSEGILLKSCLDLHSDVFCFYCTDN